MFMGYHLYIVFLIRNQIFIVKESDFQIEKPCIGPVFSGIANMVFFY